LREVILQLKHHDLQLFMSVCVYIYIYREREREREREEGKNVMKFNMCHSTLDDKSVSYFKSSDFEIPHRKRIH
jgi:hypothetical protein